MKIETRLVERKGKRFYELAKENFKNKSKKNRRRRQRKLMPSVVQKLFETCKEVFEAGGAGFVPSPGDVQRLRLILDSMTPADVGLTSNMPYFSTIENEQAPPITYLHLYECDEFSIGIFSLPPSGVIPLHNHPGMTVFSKLLFGSMHIKSYDWANTNSILNPSHSKLCGIHLASVKVDAVFTAPCNTSILYPADGGNMHCFTALTSCAVLDVLGPPYSDPQGRHCTYYHDFPYSGFSGDVGLVPEEKEGYAWLEEREKPEDFTVIGAMYRGPGIVEK